jgi:hypothetical protein
MLTGDDGEFEKTETLVRPLEFDSTLEGIDQSFGIVVPDARTFRELCPRLVIAANSRLAERDQSAPPLTPQCVQFCLLTLVVARFSLISRCTHRAHAAF